MTELADTLVRGEGLSFKTAHRLVALTIKRLPQLDAEPEVVAATLLTLAQETLGSPLRTTPERLAAALCPLNFVTVRSVAGGPAPETVARFLTAQQKIEQDILRWLKSKRALLAAFPVKLARESNKLM